MLFRLGVRRAGHEEGRPFGIFFEHFTHALAKNSPHKNIGVEDQSFTWHSASSRGQPGGYLCTPASTRLHLHPRTRSFRPDLSRRRAWLPIRPSGFASVRRYNTLPLHLPP